jgi:hypothetical protein
MQGHLDPSALLGQAGYVIYWEKTKANSCLIFQQAKWEKNIAAY